MKLLKRKTVIMIITISLLLLIIIGLVVTSNFNEVALPTYKEFSSMVKSGYYSEYLNQYQDNYDNSQEEYIFPAEDFGLENGETLSEDNSIYHWVEDTKVKLNVNVQKSGLFHIYFEYTSYSKANVSINLSVKIDQIFPYKEATQLMVDTLWKESSEIGSDRYGNDVSVLQEIYHKLRNVPLQDVSRLYQNGMYFYLEEGAREIEIYKLSGSLDLKTITIKAKPEAMSYQEYLEEYQNVTPSFISRYEAEEMEYKNSSSINRGISRDVNVLPFSMTKLKLNVIGVDSYLYPGDMVTWKVNVETAGYYYLTFKVNQPRQFTTSYRSLYINGQLPFAEARNLVFSYHSSWQNITLKGFDQEPYLFYLNPGDEISLVVDSSLFVNISNQLQTISREMTQLGLDVTKLTKNNIDKNIDWDMIKYFPDLKEKLQRWQDQLGEINDNLKSLYGFKKNSKIIQDLKAASSKINIIASDIDELPRRLTLLSVGSSCAVQLISSQIETILYQPLIIDAFYIHSIDQTLPKANGSFWNKAKTSIFRFFLSFVDKSYSEKAEEDELEVWVNRSRPYVDLIQKLSDDIFTKEYNIKVKVSLMSDDSKLLLANSANRQPDVALGVSAWIPNDYGMRGMLYDLTQRPDFTEVVKWYHPEQLVPMIYDNGLYGLPETENFYVLLYRKDILEELQLNVPNTWEDVLDILPILERYGMSFYIPLSNNSSFKSFDTTAPFIHQFGGKLYSDDCFQAAINDEKTIQALTFMSDLFREYGLAYQIPSFFNGFRYGNIPLGIADYGTYLQLINAASEIRGLWDIALVPGISKTVFNQQTNTNEVIIDRSMPGAQQAGIIFNDSLKKEESWKFLKWWMSKSTQTLFSDTIVNTLGTKYIWNSANFEAFAAFNWNEDHKQVILEQWSYLKETPKIPGSYIIEREVSNTLNSVVFNDANLRSRISDSMSKMNKEITRKMIEFKYLDNQGNILKPFTIPSAEVVRRWLEDAE